jgi:DNA-directed RNA polymerase specialized sigma24 family protein
MIIGQLCDLSQKYLFLIANQKLDSAMLQKFGASDVVQQSMLIANDKIGGFNGQTKSEFLAWMRQILINECRQAVRGFRKTTRFHNKGNEVKFNASENPACNQA